MTGRRITLAAVRAAFVSINPDVDADAIEATWATAAFRDVTAPTGYRFRERLARFEAPGFRPITIRIQQERGAGGFRFGGEAGHQARAASRS